MMSMPLANSGQVHNVKAEQNTQGSQGKQGHFKEIDCVKDHKISIKESLKLELNSKSQQKHSFQKFQKEAKIQESLNQPST